MTYLVFGIILFYGGYFINLLITKDNKSQKGEEVMTQYINKNEVENILKKLWKKDDGHNSEHRICYNKALQEVQCELDTLEVKEVDLEKIYQKGYNDAIKHCTIHS